MKQMRADADEAVRRFAAQGIVAPAPALFQGIARVLGGDLEGGDASLEDAVSVGADASAPEVFPVALCERALVAMARGEWDRAETLAGQARHALQQAGAEDSYAAPLICAAQARLAIHRGDVPAARRELVKAQQPRPLLTYALPHLAVQARIELARVHLALADLAGARTLMREIDDLLRRRPGLGTLVAEAGALRAQLAKRARFQPPRRVGADRCRAAPAAAAAHPPVVPRDRRRTVPVPQHHQVAGERRSTASWAPPPAARPSPGPASSGSWTADGRVFTPSG